jgi:hypothetical protein
MTPWSFPPCGSTRIDRALFAGLVLFNPKGMPTPAAHRFILMLNKILISKEAFSIPALNDTPGKPLPEAMRKVDKSTPDIFPKDFVGQLPNVKSSPPGMEPQTLEVLYLEAGASTPIVPKEMESVPLINLPLHVDVSRGVTWAGLQ